MFILKNRNITIFLVIAALMLWANIGMMQTEWVRYAGNPVLDLGAPGEWDDNLVHSPSVLFEDGTYKMWYAGHDVGGTYRIGYATSHDGVTWMKYAGNPVLDLGAPDEWDDSQVQSPSVLFEGGTYKMWYAAYDGSNHRIGYATSPDGVIWTRYVDNPVLDLGTPGEWDDRLVHSPSVLFEDCTYKMWYSGHDGSNWRIGYATGVPPFPVGDVSGDRTVSAYDAALILQFVVGLIDSFPVKDMIGNSPEHIIPRHYEIYLPEVSLREGQSIQVPIRINEAMGLIAGCITLKYDPTVLKAGRTLLPTHASHYSQTNINLNGEVRFAFINTDSHSTKASNELLLIEFEALANTEGKISPLILDHVQFSESLSVNKIDGLVTVLPNKSRLYQNYPNPFNPETWIPFKLAQDAPVIISIYDTKGQLIRTISLGNRHAGFYTTKDHAACWDGRDSLGQFVSSGVYYYALQAGEFRATRKMVILK